MTGGKLGFALGLGIVLVLLVSGCTTQTGSRIIPSIDVYVTDFTFPEDIEQGGNYTISIDFYNNMTTREEREEKFIGGYCEVDVWSYNAYVCRTNENCSILKQANTTNNISMGPLESEEINFSIYIPYFPENTNWERGVSIDTIFWCKPILNSTQIPFCKAKLSKQLNEKLEDSIYVKSLSGGGITVGYNPDEPRRSFPECPEGSRCLY